MCPVKTQSRVNLFKLLIWVIFGPQSSFGKTHNVSVTMTSMVAVSVNNYTHDIISFIEIFNKFITFTINKTIVSSLQYSKIFDKMLLTIFFFCTKCFTIYTLRNKWQTKHLALVWVLISRKHADIYIFPHQKLFQPLAYK